MSKNTQVFYSAQQMYTLVNDVVRYPDFLPWCEEAKVKPVSDTEVEAELTLAQGPIRKSFTTRNRLYPNERMEMCLVDGPFKKLEGVWQFDPVADGCQVTLELEFEFSNMLVRTLLGSAFDEIANTMLEHFCKQADKVYGAPESN